MASSKAAEVAAVLLKVEARGRLEIANRLWAIIGAVFRHAIAAVRAEIDPTTSLRGALQALEMEHRAAITDAAALGDLLFPSIRLPPIARRERRPSWTVHRSSGGLAMP